MTFESFNLDPRINAGIKSADFVTPTPIQQQAIPVVMQGRDLLGLAQTGTGKTAAFVLPILHRLLSGGPLRRPRVLIIAPTRELAEQIHQTIATLASHTRLRSITIYGGVGKQAQLKGLALGPEMIVACPGRLLDLMGEGAVKLDALEVLVLDEADRMFDMGFLPDIRRIIRQLPTKRQTLFFSATMPDDIRVLADSLLHNPATVQIGIIAPAETVAHALYPVPDNTARKEMLLTLLESMERERVLIFTRTKHRARQLALSLEKKGYRTAALQGNMAQNRRQAAIDGFRSGKYDLLVATDIAARGIDVSDVSHVINFDMPDTVDAYTHRIGRTGRATRSGEAFTFSGPDDVPLVHAIEKLLGEPIERRTLAGFNYQGFDPLGYAPPRQTSPPRPTKPSHSRNRGRRDR